VNSEQKTAMKREVAVILHNIRSAHNVGSILRTADASGVSHVYLSGYTPLPRDRFERINKNIAKTALGAEKFVPWSHARGPFKLVSMLKKRAWHVVGVEQDPRARNYRMFKAKGPTVFVFGNEVRGLSANLRKACDSLVEIPMHGALVRQAHHPRHTGRGKESLNVSVAAGIILFSCVS